MKDKKFFDTYSDAVIDLAEKDVQDFRLSIKKVLDENNVHDSDMDCRRGNCPCDVCVCDHPLQFSNGGSKE